MGIHKNETDRLTKMVEESETWLRDKEAELEKVGLLVMPPVTARELEQQIRPVQSEVEYLRYRPKPKPKYKPKPKKNKTNASNATANGTNDEDVAKAPEGNKK